jgi:omega-6 fatty acid desaturase (delta-12 desaturase)
MPELLEPPVPDSVASFAADAPAIPAARMSDRDILIATRPFTKESRARSWWVLLSTLAVLGAFFTTAALAPWWPVKIAASLCGSLVMVRGFIIYHDHMHGAIFRKSFVAGTILRLYGSLFLCPPSYWRETHNYHHSHVGAIEASSVGSFPIMPLAEWKQAGFWKRFYYHIARHPLTYALAYITVFFFSNALNPFIRNPIRNWQCGLAIVLHAALIALLWWAGGWTVALLCFVGPYALASALGAYLFYAQHNFVGMKILKEGTWTNARASLECSSYMDVSRLTHWLTGEIGFHHIHHLNCTIPFYRLREAMEAVPALQNPPKTTLWPRDVWNCLKLKVWDESQGRMLTFKEANAAKV